MKSVTTTTGLYALGVLALIVSVALAGLMLAPNSASAFWWSWGDNHAHAQGNQDDDHNKVNVTIQKYIDGEPATDETADGQSFSMKSSWNDPEDGEGSGEYSLSSDNSYKAVTSDMHEGADYSTSEMLDGDVVSTTCENGNPYKFAGYSAGISLDSAASAEVTGEASFTNLSEDHYVIVWNETCDDSNGTSTEPTGDISGEVTGGQSDGEPGELEVTSIDAQKTTAVANGEFSDGWQYVFNITVPTDEPELAMEFANWVHNGGDHMLPVANNMRISSDQADNGGETITLTDADTYSSPELSMTGDLNGDEDGLQVQVLVEVAVPSDTYNGTYSTDYGVRTLP